MWWLTEGSQVLWCSLPYFWKKVYLNAVANTDKYYKFMLRNSKYLKCMLSILQDTEITELFQWESSRYWYARIFWNDTSKGLPGIIGKYVGPENSAVGPITFPLIMSCCTVMCPVPLACLQMHVRVHIHINVCMCKLGASFNWSQCRS